jgi:hypothetical protein
MLNPNVGLKIHACVDVHEQCWKEQERNEATCKEVKRVRVVCVSAASDLPSCFLRRRCQSAANCQKPIVPPRC